MGIVFYSTLTVLCFINLFIYCMQSHSRLNVCYLLIFLGLSASTAGYLLVAVSTSLEEAILANKLTYIGGCFVTMLVMFAIFGMLKIKITPKLAIPFICASGLVYAFAMMAGYNDLFYKEVTMEKINGITTLSKVYGPLHNAYYILLYAYIVINVVSIIYAFAKRRDVSYKNVTIFAIIEAITVGIYFGQRSIGLYIDLVPLSFFASGICILFLAWRSKYYDIAGAIFQNEIRQNKRGYIALDLNGRFLGCNDIALEVIPEIKMQKIDLKLSEDVLDAFDFYASNLSLPASKENISGNYEIKSMNYTVTVGRFYNNKKIMGTLFELEKNDTSELEMEVFERTNKIEEIQRMLVVGLSSIIEDYDLDVGGNSKRTTDGVHIFVDEMKKEKYGFDYGDDFYDAIIKAAPLHDIGKITVDKEILNNDGKYTDEEFEKMKSHATNGALIVARMLSNIDDKMFKDVAVNVANYHHERWDGSGYPMALSGENIPIEARIMAIMDVYDALVTKRKYKEAISHDEAVDIILKSMGTHFDPKFSEIFKECSERLKRYYKNQE